MTLLTYWTVMESPEQTGLEVGPVPTREEAEAEARRYGFSFLVFHRDYCGSDQRVLRAERVVFRLAGTAGTHPQWRICCTTCGAEYADSASRACQNWRDFHEFEHMGHCTVALRWTSQGWIPVQGIRSDP